MMFLFFRIAGIPMEFSQAKDEWSRLQISGPLSIDIWAVTSKHRLVPEDRRQKLSTGQALQHRQRKEESKNVG
jgi:hypothetical protein